MKKKTSKPADSHPWKRVPLKEVPSSARLPNYNFRAIPR